MNTKMPASACWLALCCLLLLPGCASPLVTVPAECPETPAPDPSLMEMPLNADLVPEEDRPLSKRGRISPSAAGQTPSK